MSRFTKVTSAFVLGLISLPAIERPSQAQTNAEKQGAPATSQTIRETKGFGLSIKFFTDKEDRTSPLILSAGVVLRNKEALFTPQGEVSRAPERTVFSTAAGGVVINHDKEGNVKSFTIQIKQGGLLPTNEVRYAELDFTLNKPGLSYFVTESQGLSAIDVKTPGYQMLRDMMVNARGISIVQGTVDKDVLGSFDRLGAEVVPLLKKVALESGARKP